MNRRDILKTALTGAAAANASAQHRHSEAPAAKPQPPAWKPQLFDAHQNETVIVVAELIIPRTDTPGAKEARVNEYIDLVLGDGPAEGRARFLEGLGWLDGYALRLHSRPFKACSPAQQVAMLTALDRAGDDDPSRTMTRAGTVDRAAEPDRAVAPPVRRATETEALEPSLAIGARFFRDMKRLTVEGYYTSKIGIDELNKGGRVPSGFGCAHKGGSHA